MYRDSIKKGRRHKMRRRSKLPFKVKLALKPQTTSKALVPATPKVVELEQRGPCKLGNFTVPEMGDKKIEFTARISGDNEERIIEVSRSPDGTFRLETRRAVWGKRGEMNPTKILDTALSAFTDVIGPKMAPMLKFLDHPFEDMNMLMNFMGGDDDE